MSTAEFCSKMFEKSNRFSDFGTILLMFSFWQKRMFFFSRFFLCFHNFSQNFQHHRSGVDQILLCQIFDVILSKNYCYDNNNKPRSNYTNEGFHSLQSKPIWWNDGQTNNDRCRSRLFILIWFFLFFKPTKTKSKFWNKNFSIDDNSNAGKLLHTNPSHVTALSSQFDDERDGGAWCCQLCQNGVSDKG